MICFDPKKLIVTFLNKIIKVKWSNYYIYLSSKRIIMGYIQVFLENQHIHIHLLITTVHILFSRFNLTMCFVLCLTQQIIMGLLRIIFYNLLYRKKNKYQQNLVYRDNICHSNRSTDYSNPLNLENISNNCPFILKKYILPNLKQFKGI